MTRVIVSSDEPITLIGGGAASKGLLRQALALAPVLVAADGGAAAALDAGQMPEAVIGDMDSLDAASRARIGAARIHRIAEQDSTDFDKCLSRIAAPLILGVGFLGARMDHHLAACSSLVRHPWQGCVLLGDEDITFLAPPRMALDLPGGAVFSLFPMGAVRGRSEGLEWPIEGLEFDPGGRIGTSNRVAAAATGSGLRRVVLEVSAPRMLVILPREALTEVMAALSAAPRWPG